MTLPRAILSIALATAVTSVEAAEPAEVGGLRRAASLGVALAPADGGVRIEAVGPGSSAEGLGLRAGDVVVSVDGRDLPEPRALAAAVRSKRAGDAIRVTVRRESATQALEGTLRAAALEKQADYDIEYGHVAVDGSKRRTLVTRPRGRDKHPAILFIGGIGCYSLDGLLRAAPREPYAMLLDAWTRAGFVTMRVEKSGMGDSEGPPCTDPRADFEAEVRAFSAGLAKLETLPGVDRKRVFVFGHSIGPLVAARLAAARPVRGLVLTETIGTAWLEYELTNARRQLLLSGVAHDEVERLMRSRAACAHRFYVEQRTPDQIVAADASCAEYLQFPVPYTYLQQAGALDLAALWKKIAAPALIVYGTADFITDAYQHEYLRDMINAFHPGNARYLVVEGMDHGFTLAGTKQASYAGTEAPFAREVAEATVRFFKEVGGGPAPKK